MVAVRKYNTNLNFRYNETTKFRRPNHAIMYVAVK